MVSSAGSSDSDAAGISRSSPVIGHVIGGYRILREIGRGGMGTVYEAHQLSLDRIVALKVLGRTAGLSVSAITRFRREAQAAAKLHHAHIVPIYAQGEEAGLHFYAMEFVQGKTVHNIICEMRGDGGGGRGTGGASPSDAGAGTEETVLLGAAPPSTEVSDEWSSSTRSIRRASSDVPRGMIEFDEIARYVAEVADALEYAHHNGVIHRDVKPHNLMIGEDGKIRVSDFGLARVLEQPGLTVTGEFLGSPLYMSPEQIVRGDVAVDHRTDIYSLGATLYEWLTLIPPFPGDTREQVITRIITSDVRHPRVHDHRIPVDLETICLTALEKDVNRRYATAADMRDDLRRYLERRTIRARRVGPVGRLKKFVLRNRVASMAVLAIAIAVSLGTAYWRQFKTHEAVQEQRQVAAEQQSARLAEVEQKNIELEDQLKTLVESLTPATWQLLQEALGPTPDEDETRPMRDLAGRFGSVCLADYLEAERRRLEAASPIVEAGSALEHYVIAVGALTTGDVTAGLGLLNRGLELDPYDFRARHLRTILYCQQQLFGEMLSDAEVLVELWGDAPEAYLMRGAACLFDGEPVRALDDLDWAKRLGQSSGWVNALVGVGQMQLREFGRAVDDFSRALEADPELVPALLGRATCHYQARDYAAAIEDTTRIIEAEPSHARAYVLRGESYDKLERYDESIADYARASQLEKGSQWIVAKYLWAQANKQRTEQGLSADGVDSASDGPQAPGAEEAVPSTDSEQEEFLQRFLRGRLESRALRKPARSTRSRNRPSVG
ncbi:MAG: protein kinase [Phycisphaerales bacterium]|nr:MAG: protein kinase [Phycisphaerales bacterium]